MGKLYIANLHNVNLQFAEQPVEKTDLLVTHGLEPLVKLYEAHPRVKADLFFTGYSDEYLAEKHPEFITKIQDGVKRGQFAIGTYTYSHPVLTLLPYEDVRRQLERGLSADKATWGFHPNGLLLPEVCWDVCLPQIMPELGIEWVIVYNTLVPRYSESDTFPGTVLIEGIEGTQVTGILAHDKLRGPIWGIADGTFAPDRYVHLLRELADRVEDEQLVALKTDAEFLYFASLERTGKPFGKVPERDDAWESMSKLYSLLEELDFVEFVTVGEYLESHPPTETVYAESKGGNDALDRWLRGEGRERLNTLEADAREHIRAAEFAILSAERQGADVSAARQKLEEAWDHLLLAENSDGRGFEPHSSRKIFVATEAVRATNAAKEAVRAIRYG